MGDNTIEFYFNTLTTICRENCRVLLELSISWGTQLKGTNFRKPPPITYARGMAKAFSCLIKLTAREEIVYWNINIFIIYL